MKKVLFLLLVIASICVGFYAGKRYYEVPLTAGTCLDAGTQSLSQKFDEVVNILKK